MLLQLILMNIAEPLTFLFNHSPATDLVPSTWKVSKIFHVHKDGARDDPRNLHPISIVVIMQRSKVDC